MSLTKEECVKAFKRLKGMILTSPFCKDEIDLNDLKVYGTQLNDDFMDNIQVFSQLIDEHFDNHPLKFEELKEGDWVWDSLWNEYFEISDVYPKTKEFDILIHQNAINKRKYETIKFEENRFYRFEVKEYDDC